MSFSLMTQRCRFCSKFRHPGEFVSGPVKGLCWKCFETWSDAVQVLMGNGVPKACPECDRTYDEVQFAQGTPDVRWVLHPKDGIAQFLCGACSDGYERKRLDLYGDTPYGLKKKLKGAR